MRYKVIGMIALIIAFSLSLAAPLLLKDETERYHQHLKAEEKAPCSHQQDGRLCSHLPLLLIDTHSVEIPGAPIVNQATKEVLGFTLAPDGSNAITATLSEINQYGVYNHPDDPATLSSSIDIHIRGNSSRYFDKKGYAIRLKTETNENNPQSLCGMDAHHDWVLHGPFLDKTLIRNYLCYNLAGEMMEYAPNVRFCELIVNGEYMGVYLLTEEITAGKDNVRLPLSVSKKYQTYTGYLLRLDRPMVHNDMDLDSFSEYTLRTQNTLEVVYPGKKNISQRIAKSIKDDFSLFEKSLYSFDYDSHRFGYTQHIDIDSFVNYFIINEFSANYDAGSFSTYIYKGLDDRFRMCVWDFNNAFDNYQEQPTTYRQFQLHNGLWYTMLLKDEDFVNAIIRRYWVLRKTVLSEEYLNDYIDQTIQYLGPAIERNFKRWGYTLSPSFDTSPQALTPTSRNPHSYEEAVRDLKTFIQKRLDFMDENIDSLKQYCAESHVKKFNEATD